MRHGTEMNSQINSRIEFVLVSVAADHIFASMIPQKFLTKPHYLLPTEMPMLFYISLFFPLAGISPSQHPSSTPNKRTTKGEPIGLLPLVG